MDTDDGTRTVLLVEEDARVADRVGDALHEGGMKVVRISSPGHARAVLREPGIAAVVVDVRLPDGAGYEVAAFARRYRPELPVLLLAQGCDRDGLVYVGDATLGTDCATHDDVPVLAERVRNLIRRDASPPSATVRRGTIVVDRVHEACTCRGTRLPLTPIEYRLLEKLVTSGSGGASAESLFRAGWGRDPTDSSNVLAVHVGHIRRKLEDSGSEATIECIRGFGYALRCPPPREREPGDRESPRTELTGDEQTA